MRAGSSARREYERRRGRERAATRRLVPFALAFAAVGSVVSYVALEHFLDGIGWIGPFLIVTAVAKMLLPAASTQAWRTGAEGEEAVAAAISKVAGPNVRVLHDRRIPGRRANIDHLVVSSAGVFVVDAKKYKGRLTVRGGTLFINGRDRTKLLEGMQKQVAAVRSVLGADHAPCPVIPILCFVGTELPWGRTVVGGVRVTGRRGVRKLLAKDGPLAARDVRLIAERLEQRLAPA